MKVATGKELDNIAGMFGIERKIIRKRLGIFPVREKDWKLRYRLTQTIRNLPVGKIQA